MSDPAKPPIYPRYCFHLAPTVNTWCLFRVADVHGLDQHEGFEGENFYFYGNLPIKWVRIVGVVVAIDDYDAGRRVYTVDDSSGACIECTILISASQEGVDSAATATDAASKVDANPLAAAALLANINVGSVVDVKGGISTFREERQLNIEKMVPLRGTAQEVALWEKRIKFQSEVLAKPWVLRNRDIRRCRKEAERSEEEAERKRKRLKAMIEPKVAKQPTRSADQEQRSERQEPSKAKRLELRRILEHGERGKYDALGL